MKSSIILGGLFLLSMLLLFKGFNTVGRAGLFTMIAALALMLCDLYLYNRQHQ
ncbi:MAG: hypothetical protein WBI17_15135 [Clostridiaceae bacterium]